MSSHIQTNQAIPLPIEEAISINNMGAITINIIMIKHTRSIIDPEERLIIGEVEEVNKWPSSQYTSKHLHNKFFLLNSITERKGVQLFTLNSLQQVLM
jgi:hypothetical protein